MMQTAGSSLPTTSLSNAAAQIYHQQAAAFLPTVAPTQSPSAQSVLWTNQYSPIQMHAYQQQLLYWQQMHMQAQMQVQIQMGMLMMQQQQQQQQQNHVHNQLASPQPVNVNVNGLRN